jgi:hypothetical protein
MSGKMSEVENPKELIDATAGELAQLGPEWT